MYLRTGSNIRTEIKHAAAGNCKGFSTGRRTFNAGQANAVNNSDHRFHFHAGSYQQFIVAGFDSNVFAAKSKCAFGNSFTLGSRNDVQIEAGIFEFEAGRFFFDIVINREQAVTAKHVFHSCGYFDRHILQRAQLCGDLAVAGKQERFANTVQY